MKVVDQRLPKTVDFEELTIGAFFRTLSGDYGMKTVEIYADTGVYNCVYLESGSFDRISDCEGVEELPTAYVSIR